MTFVGCFSIIFIQIEGSHGRAQQPPLHTSDKAVKIPVKVRSRSGALTLILVSRHAYNPTLVDPHRDGGDCGIGVVLMRDGKAL